MVALSPAQTLLPLTDLDYHDSRSVLLPMKITALQAWNLMTGDPAPLMRMAFCARDAISSLFGVQRIRGFSGGWQDTAQVGNGIDFFLVEQIDSEVLVLTNRDRHLDVMICLSMVDRRLTATASVVTHNLFGRFYMMPVGLAHRLIVSRDLRRLKRTLEKRLSGLDKAGIN